MAKKRPQRRKQKPQSVVSDDIFIPNHSGMLDAGKVHRTPTDNLDPVNKAYVDTEILTCWLKSLGQTGLTGDKTGSFNLTTTGEGGFGGLMPYDSATFDLGSVALKWRNLIMSGDITTLGNITAETINSGQHIIDVDSTEAFLVRKDGDGGDIMVIDTTNSRVGINKVPSSIFGVTIQTKNEAAGSGTNAGALLTAGGDGGTSASGEGGDGGGLNMSTGGGGAATLGFFAIGGEAGDGFIAGGTGGNASEGIIANLGGNGGKFTMTGGLGGNASDTSASGGNGGQFSISGGNGGAGTTEGNGGDVLIKGGTGLNDGIVKLGLTPNFTGIDRTGNIKQEGTGRTLESLKYKLTALGGYAIKLTNKTGSNSVAGQLVQTDTSQNDAVKLTGIDEEETIGVFLDGGVSDGSEAWIVVSGIADVAMQDNTTATRGNWVRSSVTEAGYADATNAAPPSPASFTHFNEIGNCIETVTATGGGTHILARCVLHFN